MLRVVWLFTSRALRGQTAFFSLYLIGYLKQGKKRWDYNLLCILFNWANNNCGCVDMITINYKLRSLRPHMLLTETSPILKVANIVSPRVDIYCQLLVALNRLTLMFYSIEWNTGTNAITHSCSVRPWHAECSLNKLWSSWYIDN